MILSTVEKRIKFLSYAYCGSSHDYSMLKTELPPEQAIWFDDHHIRVDLGFLGIASEYEPPQLSIPFRKGRHRELTRKQKKKNRKMSSKRVRVEHAVGGLKRYRFLADRLRCRDMALYNLVAGICAGLWNYSLFG